MGWWKSVFAVLGVLLLVNCSPVRIQYDFDARARFGAFKSFDWVAAPKRAKDAVKVDNPIMERRVKGAIERELVAKGFRLETAADPDFLVAYYPVFRDRTFRTAHHFGGWGWHPGMMVSRQHHYTEGTIVVEILDFKTRQVVWHGAAVGALTGIQSPEDAEAAVNTEVPRLLAGFPPQR